VCDALADARLISPKLASAGATLHGIAISGMAFLSPLAGQAVEIKRSQLLILGTFPDNSILAWVPQALLEYLALDSCGVAAVSSLLKKSGRNSGRINSVSGDGLSG